jgi:hypothetical protein
VLSGLSNTRNMKYETAIQLYNLESYNCSEPGHFAPKCPKPKQAKNNLPHPTTTAQGNAAKSSPRSNNSDNTNNPAILCAARAFKLEHVLLARRIIEYKLDEGA